MLTLLVLDSRKQLLSPEHPWLIGVEASRLSYLLLVLFEGLDSEGLLRLRARHISTNVNRHH